MPNIRMEDPLPHVLPLAQPPKWRNFMFIEFHYDYTQSDYDEGFEWWFPEANGDGRHLQVHHATMELDAKPLGFAFLALFLQSQHHENRVLVQIGEKILGFQKTPTFCVPHGARSILVLNGLQVETHICVSYLLERV